MEKRVALVNMPFAPVERASIQVGILTALCDEVGVASDEFHYNLDFFRCLQEIGAHEPYCALLPALVGEWFFSRESFDLARLGPKPSKKRALTVLDELVPDDDEATPLDRLEQFATQWGVSYFDLLQIKQRTVPAFMERILDDTDWSQYGVVAFTLTYPQICASAWLAEEIKKRHPEIAIVWGGAVSQIHHDSAREFMRLFDWLDYVVVGEAEPVFGKLCQRILATEGPRVKTRLKGVVHRRESGAVSATTTISLVSQMSEMPFPDYRKFADKRASMPAETREMITADVPIELSRGCAWAVKNVCTFCGFYPDSGFRTKSTERCIEEFQTQQDQTGWHSFYVVDAYVTRGMINHLFKQLPKEVPGLQFPFVELKSDITKEQVKILGRAGVNLVQPGIESLEDSLLEKIHKGVTLFDNLLLLKWCKEQSIAVSYNIILGFPEASVEELEKQAQILARLTHLDPPVPVPLGYVRYSAYERSPERYALGDLRPDPFYTLLYPDGADTSKIAFEFSSAKKLPKAHDDLNEAVCQIIALWVHARSFRFQKPHLHMDPLVHEDGSVDADRVVVVEGRDPRFKPVDHPLDPGPSAVMRAIIDKSASPEELAVETGLDVANANTLIIDRADKYGLSQLHQLRGRVGRGRERAYAYFLYDEEKPLSETAHDRLQTIAAHTDLGGGMQIAMKDLEIRGAGNLLGAEQAGHIAGVGFDLYLRMIGEAVSTFRGDAAAEQTELRLELPVDARIPEEFIESERLRLEAYQKLSTAAAPTSDEDALGAVLEELADRYGDPPPSVHALLAVSRLRRLAQGLGLSDVVVMGQMLRIVGLELPDSRQLRLQRMYPGAKYFAQQRAVAVPLPKDASDDDLIEWVGRTLENLYAAEPAASAARD